jgi:transposase
MTEREWKRWDAVKRVMAKELRAVVAAAALGLSVRQFRRVCRAVEDRGQQGVFHGNRGKAPANKLGESLRKKIVKLRRETYVKFNDHHFADKLAEVEKLTVSRQSVQRVLRGAGIGPVREHRPPKHRRRRDRKAQAGLMVLWDGSRHDWLEGRGPLLCLMGAIDDATGELLPGAHFVEQECSAGYLRVLRAIVEEKGIPWSAYGDRHGALKRNDDHWTLEEELRGEQDPTHVGHALKALDIEIIYALSPQAKGRVERLWGTLQDRLVSELRLAGARTLEEANVVLERYRADHNRRFALEPREAAPAWRPLRAGTDVVRACSFFYEATVLNDNTVRLEKTVIDIPPGPRRRSYAKAKVEVRQLLDGSWRVYFKDALIAEAAATTVGEVRPLKRRKRSAASRAFRKAVKGLTGTDA